MGLHFIAKTKSDVTIFDEQEIYKDFKKNIQQIH